MLEEALRQMADMSSAEHDDGNVARVAQLEQQLYEERAKSQHLQQRLGALQMALRLLRAAEDHHFEP